MTSVSRNRGKHSNDDKLFSQQWHPILKDAVDDLCYLLTRGYSYKSALQIAGNRYKINKRQRIAVNRISSSNQDIKTRIKSSLSYDQLKNKTIEIDGFNLLILIESALSGGYVFKARDTTYRDISSVHGTYKKVRQTDEAISLIGKALKMLKVKKVKWFLDQPVSNSGRLKTFLLEKRNDVQLDWGVELVYSPDKLLAKSNEVVVSSDGWVLDQVGRWFNLGAYLIENYLKASNVVVV